MTVYGEMNDDGDGSDDDAAGRSFRLTGSIAASGDATYAAVTVDAVTVTVQVTEDTTPPPKIAACQFDDDGGGLLVTFDVVTDEGNLSSSALFDCASLLDYAEAQFGVYDGTSAAAHCAWLSSSELSVTFGGEATIVPYFDPAANKTTSNAVYLLADVLKTGIDGATLTAERQSAGALVPAAPTSPSASIYAPTTLGVCDGATLDGSLSTSTGTGGRDLTYLWALEAYSGALSYDICADTCDALLAAIEAALAAASAAGEVAVVLDADWLVSGASYEFSLLVENYLGIRSVAAHVMAKSSLPAPGVSIQGAELRSVYASDALTLSVDVALPNLACDTGCNLTLSSLAYEWSVQLRDDATGRFASAGFPPSKYYSPNPTLAKVAGGTLTAGLTYRFTVGVSVGDADDDDDDDGAVDPCTKLNNSDSALVYVAYDELVPIISGGASRVAGYGCDVVIDASSSYDPDALSGKIRYEWTCSSDLGVDDDGALLGGCPALNTSVFGPGSGDGAHRSARSRRWRRLLAVVKETRSLRCGALPHLSPQVRTSRSRRRTSRHAGCPRRTTSL